MIVSGNVRPLRTRLLDSVIHAGNRVTACTDSCKWGCVVNAQNGGPSVLNTSVLTKTPRDFTERRSGQHDVKSHCICGIPYKMQKQPRLANVAQTKKPGNARPQPEPRPARFRGQNTDYTMQMKKLSDDGADWLVAAVDPFHDFQRQIAGFPDMDGSASVVSCTTTQIDVAAPGAVAWDSNVFTLPITMSTPLMKHYYGVSSVGTMAQTALTTPITVGPVTVISATAGARLFPDTAVWNPAGMATAYMPITTATQGSVSRLVGWGIEVINTSPELNKSGMITVYRVPQRPNKSIVKVTDLTAGNLIYGSAGITRLCRPPCTAGEAALLPHSASWEAKEGAYVPVSMNSVVNDAHSLEYNSVSFGDQVYQGANPAFEAGSFLLGAAAVSDPMPQAQKVTPFDTVGVYMTNLDPKSTFTIKLKVYFEKFPGTADDVLLPMCTPSPRYDNRALALYSELLHDMPVGTMSENNANGDWFKAVLRILRTVGVPIASLFPGGRGMAQGILGIADSTVAQLGKRFPRMP